MTKLDDMPLTSLDEALALIDKGLGGLTERHLVSATEITDLLLDVRSLLASHPDGELSGDHVAEGELSD